MDDDELFQKFEAFFENALREIEAKWAREGRRVSRREIIAYAAPRIIEQVEKLYHSDSDHLPEEVWRRRFGRFKATLEKFGHQANN